MSRSSKSVSQIIALLEAVIFIWNSVIVPTVHTLCARASGKVNAEPSCSSFFEGVGFGETSILVRIALCERWHSLLVLILNIRKISVVPYVVVIVSFHIRCVFGRGVFHLTTSWSLKPFFCLLLKLESIEFSWILI